MIVFVIAAAVDVVVLAKVFYVCSFLSRMPGFWLHAAKKQGRL